ncbi:MAG: ABC transporter permease [Planctomycetes bacterium]|nr:ABC transporter permease [Planctomycetota bacterium]
MIDIDSPLGRAWRRFRRDRLGLAALLLLGLVCSAGTITIWIGPADPHARVTRETPRAPTWDRWMGTDLLGRDVAARVLAGGRISLLVGLVATAVALLIGVTVGATAGYAGGRVDGVLMRGVDILYGMPYLLFVLVLMAFTPRTGMKAYVNLFLALGAVQWLTMARIVRSQVLVLKQQEFVLAARALGVSPFRIVFRHLLPNCTGAIVVCATITIPQVMLEEAFLSFLGLGVPPPAASWGTLVNEGWQVAELYPWMFLGPAGVMTATLLSLNVAGDALRDALDPKRS